MHWTVCAVDVVIGVKLGELSAQLQRADWFHLLHGIAVLSTFIIHSLAVETFWILTPG